MAENTRPLSRIFGDLFAAQNAPVSDQSPVNVSGEDMERLFGAASFTQLVNMVDEVDMPQLRLALLNAEGGNLGRLLELYAKMLSSDARLAGMVRNRKLAIAEAVRELSVDENNPTAVAARDLVQKNIKMLPWSQVLDQITDGIFFGVSVLEKVWERRGSELLVTEIHKVSPRRIRQNTNRILSGSNPEDKYGELKIITGDFGSDEVFLCDLPPYKMIAALARDIPGEYVQHSVFRSVIRWWVLKTFAVKAWAQYTEKFGHPIPVAKMPKEEYEANKAAVKKILQSVGANRYALFFDSMEYEIVQAASAGNASVFESYISLCNKEIAIAVLGQNLTTEVEGGSLAASKTHEHVLKSLKSSDLTWISSVVQKQFVEPLVRVNFPGLALEDYPVWSASVPESVDLVQLSAGLAGITRLVPVPEKYIYERAQIPQPVEGELVVSSAGMNVFDPDLTN